MPSNKSNTKQMPSNKTNIKSNTNSIIDEKVGTQKTDNKKPLFEHPKFNQMTNEQQDYYHQMSYSYSHLI